MQQQHLMQQMQPMMAAYYPTNVTTDHIQQYLDENKSLILKIVESQNSGKLSECAESQARLQRNLMYLAAIADSQPQPSSIHSQFSSGGMMQPGTHSYLQQQQQQAQQMATQSLMAARSSSLLYGQQQQQQQQSQLSPFQQLGMSSGSAGGGGSTGLHHMLQSEASPHHGGGGGGSGGFPHDFGRANKQDIGSSTMSAEGRDGGSSSGENLYLKASED